MAALTSSQSETAEGLIGFIGECPSMFHTASAVRARLDAAGFSRLPEGSAWEVRPGGRYYAVRNNSSVIAFKVGAHTTPGDMHFQLAAAHADSPMFKVKHAAELDGDGYVRINVEAYGSMIDYTWFDRPLSLAGRVMVRDGARIESRLVALNSDVALIPSMPIHLNRGVNDGFAPNRQVDLCPLLSAGELSSGALEALLAEALGVSPDAIVGRDVFLYNRQRPMLWGAAQEFISAPKLDDLACAYAALRAFLETENDRCTTVYCCFDNEEVGSNTKQGAMSTFLRDALERAVVSLGGSFGDYRRALAKSMLVSCDNAHAVHPAHPEKYDSANRARLNGGIVVKEAANQHYCTDAFSRAVFSAICDDAGVARQSFANRSDMAGGSTLGNLSNIQASMHAVDVGIAQLAMHSAFETAGARDIDVAVRALAAFFAADIRIEDADAAVIG